MSNLPLIEIIKRKALLTFSKFSMPPSRISSNFEENLSNLQSLVNKVTSGDVNLDPSLLQPLSKGLEETRAPVTYIQVLDDPSVSIGMFVLKQGSRLPLHDHPLMFGILKVISGTVHIQSYSIISESDHETLAREEAAELHPSAINLSKETLYRQVTLMTRKEPAVILNSTDNACVLSPLTGNIHEIHSVDGPAAFLDVLSPPYETDIPGIGPRPCRYFKELEDDGLGLVDKDMKPVKKLLRISSPRDYWSHSAPYQGP